MKGSVINPRLLLKEKNGKQKLFELLSDSGYVPQKLPFNAMCNAIFRATPILFEGERGGGKTAFPEGLAEALGLRLFTLPCLHDTTTDHILFSWDTAAQQHFVTQEGMKGISLKETQEKQWSVDFVKFGEVLDAFYYSAIMGEPCVLLVDEVDKLSQDQETSLLQIFARGYANVPKLRPDARIGFTPEYDSERRHLAYPIVVLTSNDMASGVSSPLRSRGRYAVIPPPTIEELVQILARRVPEAPPPLLYQTSKLINGVNGLPLLEKPALREFIELLKTFVAYGYKFLTADIIDQNIDCLAKTRKDVTTISDAVDSLYFSFVKRDDAALDDLIRRILQQREERRREMANY